MVRGRRGVTGLAVCALPLRRVGVCTRAGSPHKQPEPLESGWSVPGSLWCTSLSQTRNICWEREIIKYKLLFLNIIKDFCLLKIIKFLQFTGVCIYKDYLYLVKVIWFFVLHPWRGRVFFKSSEEKTQTHSSFLFECSTKYLCILQNNLKPWILISLVLILMLKSMALSNVFQGKEILLTCFMVHIIQE